MSSRLVCIMLTNVFLCAASVPAVEASGPVQTQPQSDGGMCTTPHRGTKGQVLLQAEFGLRERVSCHGVAPWGSQYDNWCNRNCNHVPPNCPASHCDCFGPSPQPTPPPPQSTPPPTQSTPPTPQPTSPPTLRPTPPTPKPSPPPTPQPTSDGNTHDRFPYGDGNIILASDDGFPDYNLNGANNAASCRTDWRVECGDDIRCQCGEPANPRRDGCFTCLHLNYDLPRNELSEIYDWKPMTRSQIIERALGWVVSGWTYGDHEGSLAPGAPEGCASGDDACPRYSYGSGTKSLSAVCQDLVKMAWGSNRYPYKGIPIDCSNMLPGDVIHQRHVSVDGGTVHFQLFRRWLDTSKTSNGASWLVYQMGGGWYKSNAAVSEYNSDHDTCHRRPNLVDEDATVVLDWSVSGSCSGIGCRQASDADECSAWASQVLNEAEIASANVPEQDDVPGGCFILGWKDDMLKSVYFNDGSRIVGMQRQAPVCMRMPSGLGEHM